MPGRTTRTDNKDIEFTPPCLEKKPVVTAPSPGAGDAEKVGGSFSGTRHKTPDPMSPAHLKQGVHTAHLGRFRDRSTASGEGPHCPDRATRAGGPWEKAPNAFCEGPTLSGMGTRCQKSLPRKLCEWLTDRVHPGP